MIRSRLFFLWMVVLLAASPASSDPPTAPSAKSSSCSEDYAARKSREMRTIERGLRVHKRALRKGYKESDLSKSELAAFQNRRRILADRNRPVDQQDLEIIETATLMLSQRRNWDHAEQHSCLPPDRYFGLSCALRFASHLRTRAYEHRRTAIQEVRFAIREISGKVSYEHEIDDFNDAATTRHEDVLKVLGVAHRRISKRLKLQAKCGL